jgi:hypothetical protein
LHEPPPPPVPTATSRQKAKVKASVEQLNALFAAARAGQTVDPAEVARVEAGIRLEEAAAQGRQERADAEAIAKAEQARTALEGPARKKLAESDADVQALLDTAYQALVNLLDGVDANTAVHDEVLDGLIAGGFAPGEVRRADGYVISTTVGGQKFQTAVKAEYLLTLLWTLSASRRHLNGFIGVGGRNILKELPPLTLGGPRITETPGA